MNDHKHIRYAQLSSLGGHYFVGSDGSIFRLRELKINPGSHGYCIAQLFDDEGRKYWQTVHSLVAECFIGPRPEGMTINHKDGDKSNNSDENLEYVTHQENIRHAWRTGLHKPNYEVLRNNALKKRGKRTAGRKFTDEEAEAIIKAYKTGAGTMKALGTFFNCSASSIHRVVHGKITYQDISR